MMKLDVLMNGELAGTLSYTAQTHRYAFRYSPAWLSRKAPYALGPTLPLEVDEAMTEERHSALVRQFFENLLPEGQALADAASTHKVTKGNLMGPSRRQSPTASASQAGECVFNQSFSAASIRVCQPSPVARNCSTTSRDKRIVMRSLVTAAGGLPRRIVGLAASHSASV